MNTLKTLGDTPGRSLMQLASDPQTPAPAAAPKLHPYAQFILDINRYNPANYSPFQLIDALARRTTGDFFFPMERLDKYRSQQELERLQQQPAEAR